MGPSGSGRKQLVVKLKPAPTTRSSSGSVLELREAVDAIYGSRETPCTLEELFR